MAAPKLHYFDTTGRAECLRCAFVAANIPFEDVRYSFQDFFTQIRPRSPSHKVPVLEMNGTLYIESRAILTYLCGLNGMVSSDPEEMLVHNMVMEYLEDFWTPIRSLVIAQTDEDKKEALAMVAQATRALMTRVEAFVKTHTQSHTGHILKGKKYSPADLVIYCLMRELVCDTPMGLKGLIDDVPHMCPSLWCVYQAVLNDNPRIAEYHKGLEESLVNLTSSEALDEVFL
eukprot:Blabericola_migrator_1__2553@NODE_171_length_12111_cov_153_412405_g148_i0_p6_GENE_NODE_171_length_12111_cov_153_412405_g148_i0NODE_171_length_12111_cov_153_412405_g148_i0_p6_ORF_typecomplete_len230_score62_69GST_N/PF02798_20/6_9e11GST_N_3/PF13417_6/3_3e07GST_N_3/PF13417_6/4_9e03GST_C_3/PF14497_6/0_001GST_N_4/PF17172_4/0_025Med14/PF08638_11/0_015GST_C_5/PF16865_5/0_19GST_C_5/PF16865_5/4_1e03Sec6/PF06046_13/1_3e03Sec6/PF06046_13/0_17_NODE_171_length_12111_cov_153_412405_g148_i0126815